MLRPARTPPRLATLILLSALSVVSLNLFLPSLAAIARAFGTDDAVVTLAISGYAGVTAVLQLVIGPLSDRFGRRPVMLVSLAVGQRIEPPLLPVLAGGVSSTPDRKAVTDRLSRRGHVLVGVFLVGFFGQFLYFSGFFEPIVDIGEQYVTVLQTYVDTLFVSESGTSSGDATKKTPRFATIPVRALFINTIGSGMLAGFTVLGVLSRLETGKRLTVVLLTWFVTAGAVMVFGTVSDVPFALPNRIYVMVEITGVGIFGAVGLVYCYRRALSFGGVRPALVLLLVLAVSFTFFSTASTIAGIETSPFNDQVPHAVWYDIVQDRAAAEFVDGTSVNRRIRAAGGFITINGTFDYSGAPPGTIISISEQGFSTGIKLGGGAGKIGGAGYLRPRDPRAGLRNVSRIYDNGNSELYVVPG